MPFTCVVSCCNSKQKKKAKKKKKNSKQGQKGCISQMMYSDI